MKDTPGYIQIFGNNFFKFSKVTTVKRKSPLSDIFKKEEVSAVGWV